MLGSRRQKSKGQASVEYLIVVGVALSIILSMSYFFFFYKSTSEEEVLKENVNQLGKEIIKNAEEVYFSAGASKKTLEFNFPTEVTKLGVEDHNYLVVTLKDGSELMFESKTPIYVFYEKDEKFSKDVCIQKISHKDREDVIICAAEGCNCHLSNNESGELCWDGMDNDLDDKTDMQDYDCCPVDADGDGYTDSKSCIAVPPDGIGADDCDDANPAIHPGAPEECNGIDHDCDGEVNDAYGCKGYGMDELCAGGLCFYVEELTEDDDPTPGACRPGYKALLSLSDITNAHAEVAGGINQYPHDLCYMENPGHVCKTECIVTDDAGCGAGYTKILSLYNQSMIDGSHVEFGSTEPFPDNVCCKAECGTTVCRLSNTGSCNADESWIVSIDPETNSHVSPNTDDDFVMKVCCKIS